MRLYLGVQVQALFKSDSCGVSFKLPEALRAARQLSQTYTVLSSKHSRLSCPACLPTAASQLLSTHKSQGQMHAMHSSCGCLRAANMHAQLSQRTGRYHGMCPPQAAKQQQQQPAEPVAANYRELMQHYSSMVQSPTKQQPRQASSPGSGSSSSSSKGSSKGVPRLKPTKQTATPGSSGGRNPSAAQKGRPARPAAAGQQAGSTAIKPKQQGGPSSSGRGSSSSSSSRSQGFDSKPNSSSKGVQAPAVIPAAWSLPSNGRGFGSKPAAAPAPVQLGPDVVKVFRFGVDAAAVSKAIEGCGWQGRVAVVDTLQQADLILAVKNTQGGKHRNLAQVRARVRVVL